MPLLVEKYKGFSIYLYSSSNRCKIVQHEHPVLPVISGIGDVFTSKLLIDAICKHLALEESFESIAEKQGLALA